MVRWQRDMKQMVVMVRTGKLNVNCFVIVSWGWRWHLVRIKIFCLCCHSVVQCPPPWPVTSIQTLIIVYGLSPLMCQSLITMQNWSLLVTHSLHHSGQCHSVWCQCVTNQNNVTDHAKSPDNVSRDHWYWPSPAQVTPWVARSIMSIIVFSPSSTVLPCHCQPEKKHVI